MIQIKQFPPYQEVQKKTIEALSDIGLKFSPNFRIPIFKLWSKLIKRPETPERLRVLRLLNFMLEMRRAGLEPAHKRNYYLPTGD